MTKVFTSAQSWVEKLDLVREVCTSLCWNRGGGHKDSAIADALEFEIHSFFIAVCLPRRVLIRSVMLFMAPSEVLQHTARDILSSYV